jgi:virginiamycin B lyase
MRRLVLCLLLSLTALAAGTGTAAAAPDIIGQVEEFELGVGTRPEALVAGPDGNLWFAGVGYSEGSFTDVLGKVTPQGEVTEYTVGAHPENLGLSDIAVGPDGALWFTIGGRPRVGRITTGGEATLFELPNPDAKPFSIVAGPDGALWFTESQGGKIGRITPAGAIAEFPLRDGSGSAGIAVGSDGALWFTQPLGGLVSRIATDGSETPFQLPEPLLGEVPRELVAGPDGALWFGLLRGAALGRITTAGAASSVPVPGGRQTFALSSGPFGSVWYSNGGGRIGWIIPGVVDGTPACINSCRVPIAALAEGPNGKLWFAAGVEPGTPASARGTIGTYAPPPLEIRLVGDVHVQNQAVVLPVRCRFTPAGKSCKGRLRLAGGGRPLQRRLSLRLGARKRVSLRLPAAASRRLARRGRLVLRASTSVAHGRRDTRRIVLRRP